MRDALTRIPHMCHGLHSREQCQVLNSGIVETKLNELIQHIAGGRRALAPSTAIYHDLFIGGDDAFELLETIARDFEVSFEEFCFTTYFPNETEMGPISYWMHKLGLFASTRPRLTIEHLLQVIYRKSWFEPERSG